MRVASLLMLSGCAMGYHATVGVSVDTRGHFAVQGLLGSEGIGFTRGSTKDEASALWFLGMEGGVAFDVNERSWRETGQIFVSGYSHHDLERGYALFAGLGFRGAHCKVRRKPDHCEVIGPVVSYTVDRVLAHDGYAPQWDDPWREQFAGTGLSANLLLAIAIDGARTRLALDVGDRWFAIQYAFATAPAMARVEPRTIELPAPPIGAPNP